MELTALLERMKLDHLAHQIDAVCEQAAGRDLDYKAFLAQALETEYRGRFQRGIEARLKQARFPWLKNLEQFDFDFQPSLDRKLVRELAGMSFVERAHNVVLLGPPGVGKTHLAIALGMKAVEAGYSALFLTLEQLMTRLTRARHENRLERTLQQLVYPKVVVLDELGYLPLSREEASLFFRLLARRYERASLIVTATKASSTGARSSRTTCSPPRSSTDCSITHHAQHQGRELPAQGEAPRRAARPGPPTPTRGGDHRQLTAPDQDLGVTRRRDRGSCAILGGRIRTRTSPSPQKPAFRGQRSRRFGDSLDGEKRTSHPGVDNEALGEFRDEAGFEGRDDESDLSWREEDHGGPQLP